MPSIAHQLLLVNHCSQQQYSIIVGRRSPKKTSHTVVTASALLTDQIKWNVMSCHAAQRCMHAERHKLHWQCPSSTTPKFQLRIIVDYPIGTCFSPIASSYLTSIPSMTAIADISLAQRSLSQACRAALHIGFHAGISLNFPAGRSRPVTASDALSSVREAFNGSSRCRHNLPETNDTPSRRKVWLLIKDYMFTHCRGAKWSLACFHPISATCITSQNTIPHEPHPTPQ